MIIKAFGQWQYICNICGSTELHHACPGHSFTPPNPTSDSARVHETQSLDATLQERGSKYGDFRDHAHISQRLKDVAACYWRHSHTSLHKEAIDMIFHKIARILNGDPNYSDSWIDIAGYAKLVADRVGDPDGKAK